VFQRLLSRFMPPRKRSRTNDQQDEDFSFSDGSIVLSAKNADENLVYFRVHKSVLAKNSPVFEDMLTMPTPANQDSYDGLPLVHLHDDAKHLKEVLTIFYDPCALLVDGRASIAAALRGSLKLATKYQVENLRNVFIQKLQMEWPTTLAEWDALKKEDKMYFAGEFRDDHYSGIISIINLANDCDVPSVLPTAFYWLFSLLRKHGYRHDKVLPLLSHQDIQRLVVGGLAIDKFLLRAYAGDMEIAGWRCQDRKSPCGACHLEVSLWWGELLNDFALQGPLESLKYAIEELKPETGVPFPIGNSCKKALADRLKHIRRKIFGNLRSHFSLPAATGSK